MILTNSRVTTYRACPRKEDIAYNKGVRPVERSYPLRFGDVSHKGHEAWWAATGEARLEAGLKAIRDAIITEEMDEFELVKAEETMRGYHYRWIDSQEGIKTIYVEHEFHLPLLSPLGEWSPFQISGKMDALAELQDRGVFVVEYKTSTEDISPGSTYWRKLTLNSQVSTYHNATRKLGYTPSGCLYDVLFRPTLKPANIPLTDADGVKIVLDSNNRRVQVKSGKKWRETGDKSEGYVLQTREETPEEYRARLREDIAANPDAYYQRAVVVRTEWDERESELDLWHTAQMMKLSLDNDWHPRNDQNCFKYGGECPYLSVCTGTGDLNDPLVFRRVENEHEELTNTGAAVVQTA